MLQGLGPNDLVFWMSMSSSSTESEIAMPNQEDANHAAGSCGVGVELNSIGLSPAEVHESKADGAAA